MATVTNGMDAFCLFIDFQVKVLLILKIFRRELSQAEHLFGNFTPGVIERE